MKWAGLAAACLLLALWIASYQYWGDIRYSSTKLDKMAGVSLAHGFMFLELTYKDLETAPFPWSPGWYLHVDTFRDDESWTFSTSQLWFSWATGLPNGCFSLAVPMWLMTLMPAAFSVLAWRSDARARRRTKNRLCGRCAYDRIGIAESAPCPECGAAAEVTEKGASR